MLGGVIFAAVLLVVFPVLVIMSGPPVAAIIGWLLKDDAERRAGDSVWTDLNT